MISSNGLVHTGIQNLYFARACAAAPTLVSFRGCFHRVWKNIRARSFCTREKERPLSRVAPRSPLAVLTSTSRPCIFHAAAPRPRSLLTCGTMLSVNTGCAGSSRRSPNCTECREERTVCHNRRSPQGPDTVRAPPCCHGMLRHVCIRHREGLQVS